jgi:hypothetical protein
VVLQMTGDVPVDKLVSSNPLALLIDMVLNQQVRQGWSSRLRPSQCPGVDDVGNGAWVDRAALEGGPKRLLKSGQAWTAIHVNVLHGPPLPWPESPPPDWCWLLASEIVYFFTQITVALDR